MIAHLRYGTYIFFGVFTLIGAAYIYLLVPETAGLSLVSCSMPRFAQRDA